MCLGFALWCVNGFVSCARCEFWGPSSLIEEQILGGALQPIQSIFPLFVVIYGLFQTFGEMVS